MPVSVTAAASAMPRPRVRTNDSASASVSTPAVGGGGDLTDAVACDGAEGGRGTERGRGQQARGDQQGLGHGRVADRVCVCVRAVVGKVQLDGVRPRGDAVGGTGKFEPGSQEAGRLSALAGSDEYEHPHTLSCGGSLPPVGTGTKNRRGNC